MRGTNCIQTEEMTVTTSIGNKLQFSVVAESESIYSTTSGSICGKKPLTGIG